MMPSDDLPVIETTAPRCRYLLSKGTLINAGLPSGHEVVGDGYFWCAQTQHSRGPDNDHCDLENCCTPGRSCYQES